MHINIKAGDLPEGKWKLDIISSGKMTQAMFKRAMSQERFEVGKDLVSWEQVDEAKLKKLAGMAGWGFLGAAILGPLGAIGGLLFGGNKREVIFVGEMNDGRKFLAATDHKTWTKLRELGFKLA